MTKNSVDTENNKFGIKIEKANILLNQANIGYKESIDRFAKLDSKINSYIVLIMIILGLFVEFIALPSECCFLMLYFLVISLLILSLIFMIISYNPKNYDTINTYGLIDKYQKNVNSDDYSYILTLGITIANTKKSVDSKCSIKAKYLNICSWLIFSALILIIILNIFG